MKRPITQKDASGCGLACVAFIANQPYTVIQDQTDLIQAKYTGFTMMELRQLLKTYGIDASQGYVKRRRREIYKDNTIVFIKSSARYPAGHYLVRYKGHWMDPWINSPQDGRIKQAKSGYRKRLPGQPVYAIFVEPI